MNLGMNCLTTKSFVAFFTLITLSIWLNSSWVSTRNARYAVEEIEKSQNHSSMRSGLRQSATAQIDLGIHPERRLLDILDSSSESARSDFLDKIIDLCEDFPQFMASKIHSFGLSDRERAIMAQVIVKAWDDKVAALNWVANSDNGIWHNELLEFALAECVVFNRTAAFNYLEDLKMGSSAKFVGELWFWEFPKCMK